MIEARSLHRVEHLVSDIASALEHIRALSGEYTHESAEMLSALDTLAPELRARRDVMSAAWAGVDALAERAQGHISELEPFINPAHRRE